MFSDFLSFYFTCKGQLSQNERYKKYNFSFQALHVRNILALLDLLGVSKQFQTTIILNEVDFFVNKNERIAIIGKNGSGKSTLMKIIDGSLEADNGRRIAQNNLKIEMLAQVPKFDESLNVKEAIKSELKEILEVQKAYQINAKKLSEDFENKELLEKQEALGAFLDTHDAWNLDDKLERVMSEFSLKEYETTNITLLSGGEQRRVALAGLLLKKPDILLLDEPTNHLDVYMVFFLEKMLLSSNFTLVFISHDRYFIDAIATKSVEIEDAKLREFEGGYAKYLSAKELLLSSMQKTHETLLKHLKAEEEWLRRGVKARLKRNEGRKKRVLELREEAKKNPSIIRRIKVELERAGHNFNQSASINRQKMLFEIKNLSKKLGNKNLIENFNTRILQKDRIGIVGKNGSGKSTFLHLLLGNLPQDSGTIKMGDIQIGYFDQNRKMLDDDKTLIETFCPNGGDRVDVRGKNYHVYGYLKNFLFPKEFLDKKIGYLSGGEKNRVALALLFSKKVDCLVLDEPTNDLDIPTINILEEYIESFSGAVLFVSHDRYFVDKIAKKLFVFKGDGRVEENYQSYSELLENEDELQEIENFEESLQQNIEPIKTKTKPTKLSYKEQQEYEKLPLEIEELEKSIKELQECLNDPKCYEVRGLIELSKELEESECKLEILVEKYLQIEEKLESFSS